MRTTTRSTPMPLNGSAISSAPDTLPQATLTSAASLTCERTTSPDTPNATFSQASAAGPTPYASPDGQMIDLFGQEVVPVNRSVRRENTKGSATTDTFGLNGSVLS